MFRVVRRKDGWAITYNHRALCGLYQTKREAQQDARGLRRTTAADAQLKKDLQSWSRGE